MNKQKQQPTHGKSYSSIEADNEIDLRELFRTLWAGKFVIITATVLFALGALALTYTKSSVYQVEAKLFLHNDPYGLAEGGGLVSGAYVIQEANEMFLSITTESFHKDILNASGDDNKNIFDGINFSRHNKSGVISLLKRSAISNDAFDGIKVFSDNVNQSLKKRELEQVLATLFKNSELLENKSGRVKEILEEKQAQLLYKKAYLEIPSSQLVSIIKPPKLPTSPIQSNNLKFVFLGAALGAGLAVMILLLRFSFRDESD
ncbi:Wzz/FepE/Etk N-terminal domain-containing protein [Vibrio lamellibrachiae]|uniref:Wzz/FepE/Etk N-terminal domain-containing protein n=1 Tax=Vibrio lamellibrachiae TaxID=2910253 RepID=UPI003D0E2B1B